MTSNWYLSYLDDIPLIIILIVISRYLTNILLILISLLHNMVQSAIGMFNNYRQINRETIPNFIIKCTKIYSYSKMKQFVMWIHLSL